MSAYLVGTVTVTDPERYSAYAAAIRGMSARFGGEPIVAGLVSEVMEGESAVGERIVVTRFPSDVEARAYLTCPEYLAAKALRLGAATVGLRLIVA